MQIRLSCSHGKSDLQIRHLNLIIFQKLLNFQYNKDKHYKGPHTRSILLSNIQHCTNLLIVSMCDIDAKILCNTIDINNIASIKLIVYGPLKTSKNI